MIKKKLPQDFNVDTYLLLNPDLANIDISLDSHYQRFGENEGRLYKFPPLLKTLSKSKFVDKKKSFILITSHETTRTGAPILCLNIIRELSKKYNVIVLLTGSGHIEESFYMDNVLTICHPDCRSNQVYANHVIESIIKIYKINFAILNTVATLNVLRAIANNGIATIGLIHEFASDGVIPHSDFREFLFWCTEVVFSSELTLQNSLVNFPDFIHRSMQVLPQGKCPFIPTLLDSKSRSISSHAVRTQLRSKGRLKNLFLVLGAGTIVPRKGIDIFIETARQVVAQDKENIYRFIWYGSAKYDPVISPKYLLALKDQINRSNLSGIVEIYEEIPDIDVAYKNIDILLLSSRLDPLPNVAIDCITLGVPVICFDKASGIADMLSKNVFLKKKLIADYINPASAAEKIVSIFKSPSKYKKISTLTKDFGAAHLRFASYIKKLERVCLASKEKAETEFEDVKTILGSGLFRKDFSAPPNTSPYHAESDAFDRKLGESVIHYVRTWRVRCLGLRKPFPGFNPSVYQENHIDIAQDPLAHFIRSGKQPGRWINDVIQLADKSRYKSKEIADKNIGLHIHAYHVDILLKEILPRFKFNLLQPNLLISTNTVTKKNLIYAGLKGKYSFDKVKIKVTPNIGRDIGSFLNDYDFSEFDFIGHIHTKRSPHVDREVSDSWNNFLFDNLLGTASCPSMDIIVERLVLNKLTGMAFPDDPNVIGWTENLKSAKELNKKLKLGKLPLEFNFPVGTMFWARPEALRSIFQPKFGYSDFPIEPVPGDGTTLHAIERLFPLIVKNNGYTCSVINTLGITR
jgi:glycosyltransferase involved in cell wall biosynthesis